MAQQLRTPVALSEDPGLVPSLSMVAYSHHELELQTPSSALLRH